MDLPESVLAWTCEDARKWLLKRGHACYVQVMCDTHRIDGLGLLTLTEDDLKKPPLEFRVLGDIKRLAFDLSCLRASHPSDMGKINFSPNRSVQYPVEDSSCNLVFLKAGADGVVSNGESWMFESNRSNSPESHISDFFGSDPYILSPADDSPASKGMARNLEPEVWKAILSFCYFLTATIITSMVMVIVHDRVPDMKKYPPLPDIFLDSVPLIPWAFYMCEVTGCLLSVIWILVLTFHKHRFILMRRFFALSGSVFLLRCITMLITSLSVPGAHLECSPRPYGDVWAKLGQALLIWQGFGMSVRGVRTCGDYMFSGHTVVLTMLNFFITEYTPRRLYFLHTLSWVLNVFGVFFILAAHEHYSIDVFVAFYITSRLFLYYHTLANSSALRQRDRHRAKIWFPLFSFFEARVDGMVPNEYELPWARMSLEPVRNLFSIGQDINSSPVHRTSATTNGKKARKRR